MKAQLFNFETKFNFGKHKDKSLREVLYKQPRYIGWLIARSGDPRFVLDLDVLKQLDEKGFFYDMPVSMPDIGGFWTTKDTTFIQRDEIIETLRNRYNRFKKDPANYEIEVKNYLIEIAKRIEKVKSNKH